MKEKKQSTLSLVWYFLKGSKRFFLLTALMALGMTVAEMLPPQIIKIAVDSIIGDAPLSIPALFTRWLDAVGGVEGLRARLWLPAVAIAVVSLLAAAFRYGFRVLNTKAGETLVERMRNTLFAHIQRLPFHWHMENQTGDIIQRCTSDVDLVRNFLSEQLTAVFRIVILLVVSVYCMATISLPLTLLAMILLTLIMLYSLFFHKQIGDGFRAADEQEGVLSTMVQENLTGVRVVRAFGKEEYERERFFKADTVYSDLWMKLCFKLSTFWTSTSLVSGVQAMLMVVLGAGLCVNGEMTAGAYIAFLSYNAMLTWPVRQLGRMISEMSKAGVSIERIKHIMYSEPEQDKPTDLTPDMTGDIVLQNVTFGYGAEDIVKDISFTIKAGQTLGILGGTGSGKSTLVALLDRLYDLPPEKGRITVGGVDIQQISRAHLRRNIGLVLQEPYLFSRSIADNIGIAREDITEEEIREVCKVAHLDRAIEGFSKGYDTFVGERGVTLSGGQKQRAAIARMIANPSPIMILDDSLSAVDTETDALIRAALSQKLKAATTLLISHRITTLMNADNIIVLDKGRIVEQGTHRALCAAGGIYQRIYEMQARGEEWENE